MHLLNTFEGNNIFVFAMNSRQRGAIRYFVAKYIKYAGVFMSVLSLHSVQPSEQSWLVTEANWGIKLHPILLVVFSIFVIHDDVIEWKHFPRYWPFVRGIHRPPVNSPHKGQWRGDLMFFSIYAWMNGWVNRLVIWDVIALIWRHCNALVLFCISFIYVHPCVGVCHVYRNIG